MKVHITSTPEFSEEKVNEVIALLKSVPGEIVFEKSPTLDISTLLRIDDRFENINEIEALSFVEMFELARIHRANRKADLNDDDIVIIITSIPNDQYWFSAVSEKNVFIYGDEWDLISNVDSKFSVAHQCVENVFESLLGIDVFNIKDDPIIHMETTGCLMDFCEQKKDILVKILSATICDKCYQRSIELGITDIITAHVVDLLEMIRKEFAISKRFSSSNPTEIVNVDKEGIISIGGRKINFGDIQQALYIYFLKKIDGVQNNKLCEQKSEIEKIYTEIRGNTDEYTITKLCCKKIKYRNHPEEKIKPTFETNRTRTKTAIKKVVGETMANQYSIQLTTDESTHIKKFKIPLKPNQIEIHPRFLNL